MADVPGIVDPLDDDAIPQPEKIVQFTEGEPSSLSCWIGVKLTTRQYENVTYGYGLGLTLKKDADISLAEKQLTAAIEGILLTKIKAVRAKYDPQ